MRERLLRCAAAVTMLLLLCAGAAGEPAPEPYVFDIPASYEGSELQRMGYAYAECYVLCTVGQRMYIIPVTAEGDLTVDQGDGVTNTFHVTRDSVCMACSTCENQDCVDEGTVTLANREERILGNMIVCMPHNVMLELFTFEELETLLETSS